MSMPLNQALNNVFACPATTFLLLGAPGVGKTTATINEALKRGRHVIRVDAQNIPAEDLARLPVLNKSKTAMTFAIPEMWTPRPNTVIVLDELLKAPEDVVNAFLPLLHGKQLFGHCWPADTIVVVTSNSAEFRVGDKLQPHVLNRMVKLEISDPTASEAEALMLDLGFDSRIIRWTQQVPSALISYNADTASKPESELDFYFGYSPRSPREPFCSLRSLHTASMLLQSGITDSDTLAGAIGKKAAHSLALYCKEIRSFVQPAHILDGSAKVPENLFDSRMACITAVAIMDDKNWETVLNYIERLPAEIQSLACRAAARKSTLKDLCLSRRYNAWVTKNS